MIYTLSYNTSLPNLIAKNIKFPIENDWLYNNDILLQALKNIEKNIKIDRNFDIPYAAGYSKDGKTIFIHRRLPRYFKCNGKRISVDAFLALHEAVEMSLEHKLGLRYQLAHQIALRIEKAVVEAKGISWKLYNKLMSKYIEKAIGQIEKVPSSLDLQPYRDEDDFETIKKMKLVMVPVKKAFLKKSGLFEPPPQFVKDLQNLVLEHYASLILKQSDLSSDIYDLVKSIPKPKSDNYIFIDLTGWKYLDKIPKKRLDQENGKFFAPYPSVKIVFTSEDKKELGKWSVPSWGIIINIPEKYLKPNNIEEFYQNLNRFFITAKHESIHMGQTILTDLLKLRENVGLPPKRNRIPGSEFSGFITNKGKVPNPEILEKIPEGYVLPHSLRDKEFYTRLSDIASVLKSYIGNTSKEERIKVFKEMIPKFNFLNSLKEHNLDNWKIAIKILSNYLLNQENISEANFMSKKSFFSKREDLSTSYNKKCLSEPLKKVLRQKNLVPFTKRAMDTLPIHTSPVLWTDEQLMEVFNSKELLEKLKNDKTEIKTPLGIKSRFQAFMEELSNRNMLPNRGPEEWLEKGYWGLWFYGKPIGFFKNTHSANMSKNQITKLFSQEGGWDNLPDYLKYEIKSLIHYHTPSWKVSQKYEKSVMESMKSDLSSSQRKEFIDQAFEIKKAPKDFVPSNSAIVSGAIPTENEQYHAFDEVSDPNIEEEFIPQKDGSIESANKAAKKFAQPWIEQTKRDMDTLHPEHEFMVNKSSQKFSKRAANVPKAIGDVVKIKGFGQIKFEIIEIQEFGDGTFYKVKPVQQVYGVPAEMVEEERHSKLEPILENRSDDILLLDDGRKIGPTPRLPLSMKNQILS